MAKIPSNELKIFQYIHCGLCADDFLHSPKVRGKISPRDYAQLELGWTKEGLQVWCKRHECNVMHIDFEGQKHPANTTRKPTKKEKIEKMKELKKLR